MNILYAGTPEPSARILHHLVSNSKYNVVGVLTQPDKPQKRGKKIACSPVSDMAKNHEVQIFKPLDLNEKAFIETISSLRIDLIVVAAYGKILPKWLLDISSIMPINIHYSLLPKYRGASPIQSSILNGDKNTGVTFMKMSQGLDEGDIVQKNVIGIQKNHNKTTLENDLCSLAIENIDNVLDGLKTNNIYPVAQENNLATYCSKIKKEDSLIKFNSPSEDILNKYRAYYEWPGTAFFHKNIRIKIDEMQISDIDSSIEPGKIIKFDASGLYIKTIDKAIVITYLQFPSKKIISSSDAFNAYRDFFV
ncbi:methionyl-tRNA formyltransferase [Gammaproteobacteria bacterium]|nr:methionyl-tRNA formyltransferase [Gammaproteobacteria bacterium]